MPWHHAAFFSGSMVLLSSLPHQAKAAEDAQTSHQVIRPKTVFLPTGPVRKVEPYKLESVEMVGSGRMTTDQLTAELGLAPGLPLDDRFVMTARSRILGLGLFKSAILMMRRGTEPGQAKLVIEVEDDPSVLTDWAIGGDLGITVAEDNAYASLNSAEAPMDYRVGLVSRNAFGDLHRASAVIDMDHTGSLRSGQIAYGLPRFTHEAVQFDAEVSLSDPTYRYLDTLGFGGRGQGLWSLGLDSRPGDVQYGVAMYVNNPPRFGMRGYPTSLAGPKIAYYEETRLRRFFYSSGHRFGASIVLSPIDPSQSVFEFSLAGTAQLTSWLYLTTTGDALTVGSKGVGLRAEGRLDLPLGHSASSGEQGGLFLRLRGGQDRMGPYEFKGSSAIFGVRYHSSGFIAELAFRITHAPPELLPSNLLSAIGAGP